MKCVSLVSFVSSMDCRCACLPSIPNGGRIAKSWGVLFQCLKTSACGSDSYLCIRATLTKHYNHHRHRDSLHLSTHTHPCFILPWVLDDFGQLIRARSKAMAFLCPSDGDGCSYDECRCANASHVRELVLLGCSTSGRLGERHRTRTEECEFGWTALLCL